MVDFSKKLSGKPVQAEVDPIKLYDTLDRTAEKGPLRPAQEAVLKEWHSKRSGDKDIIVKLHTGQGKTLIGLLMLQSKLNQSKAPVLYLCPNNFLVEQTKNQAESFGIKTCTTDDDLPDDFLNAKSIFITSVHKLFNGKTKFGLGNRAVSVGTILMDDAHACADSIRAQCRIKLENNEHAYSSIISLFSEELEAQGVGTFADILNKKHDAFLPVPYWAWIEKEAEVAKILAANTAKSNILFSWPLLKDILSHCLCIVSGSAIEIEPYLAPTHLFKTYTDAAHRIFMSATVTDDSFLVKGLRLTPETVTSPLTYDKETWSGEKMVLVPSLIHEDLDRGRIVSHFGKPSEKRAGGRVVLAPSYDSTKAWEAEKAKILDKDSVGTAIESLKNGDFEKTLVLVNRYDGIDLADKLCRILIFDGKPYSESLIDLYQESCRPESQATLVKMARTIEQGMGRSVRGEKDYSVIIVTGADLTRFIRDKSTRTYLSNQLNAQIEIGLEIAEMAQADLANGDEPIEVLKNLIAQCLNRDESWKAFYIEKMDEVKQKVSSSHVLEMYAAELDAEEKCASGDYNAAVKSIQGALDDKVFVDKDKGWHLQEMARYKFRLNKVDSQKLQLNAFNSNRYLLKPPAGVVFSRLTIVSQGRMERIIDWVSQFETYEQLSVAVNEIVTNLSFGVKADKFEHALDELSVALGFKGERPDKQWKEGPDNLWAIEDGSYILWECKSEVETIRSEINKYEANQMNTSCAWFYKNYSGSKVRNILIHPAKKLNSAATLTHDVDGLNVSGLSSLLKKVKAFFTSFEGVNLKDLSANNIQEQINQNDLSVDSLCNNFARRISSK